MNTAQSLLADTWMHGDFGWGWMTLMMILMVLFWGGLIFGIAWLVRSTAPDRPGRRAESPIDVLDRRFAEGAIPVEDYQARREVLLNGTAGSDAARKKDEPLTAAQTGGGKQ